MSLRLSLLIPVHQGGEKFRQCLQSVHLYAPVDTQLIVVADGNTGNDASLARSFGTTVLTTSQAVGAGLARNLAARRLPLTFFFLWMLMSV